MGAPSPTTRFLTARPLGPSCRAGGRPRHIRDVSHEGADGEGGDLPDGTFETTQDMNVQEIQSINR